jgi:hypothetical protein
MSSDLKIAFKYVWLVVSVVTGCAILAPFVFVPATLHSLFPACEARVKYHTACPLCGMTTAFIYVAGGQWRNAQAANSGAVPLFLVWLVNLVVALYYWLPAAGRALAAWTASGPGPGPKGETSCKC